MYRYCIGKVTFYKGSYVFVFYLAAMLIKRRQKLYFCGYSLTAAIRICVKVMTALNNIKGNKRLLLLLLLPLIYCRFVYVVGERRINMGPR